MKISLRMRPLPNGDYLVAPIDPETREQLDDFRKPTEDERKNVDAYLIEYNKALFNASIKINVTSD